MKKSTIILIILLLVVLIPFVLYRPVMLKKPHDGYIGTAPAIGIPGLGLLNHPPIKEEDIVGNCDNVVSKDGTITQKCWTKINKIKHYYSIIYPKPNK